MTASLLLSLCLGAGLQSATPAAQPDPQLIRVHVQTDEGGIPEELSARRDSVRHLADAIARQKKGKVMVVVDSEDTADVVVEVVDRGARVPKVVIGLGGMGSQPGRPVPLPPPALRLWQQSSNRNGPRYSIWFRPALARRSICAVPSRPDRRGGYRRPGR